jgi:hypothetical protein
MKTFQLLEDKGFSEIIVSSIRLRLIQEGLNVENDAFLSALKLKI